LPEVVETNAAFLLTDIVGSTRLHHLYPQAMLDAIARHNEVVEKVVVYHGGELFRRRGEGDSTFSVFPSPVEAVRAAIELQRALMNFVVVDDEKLRTRVGIHSGEAVLFDGDYQGTTVNLCARIRSAANGGQIVTTEPVRAGSKGIVFRELGIYRLADVSDELKLYQPIADGIDRDFPPLRVPFSGNVPTPISPFIGRIDELDAVRQLVQENRLVTLQGLGGFGKTRLAIEVTTQLAHRYSGGTWFVAVEHGATSDSLVGQFLQVVSRSSQLGQVLQLHNLRDERSYFVVIDNCEVAQDAARAFAKELLTALPNLKAIATSRELLHLPGEAPYHVPPMSLPSGASQGDAMALLVSHLRRAKARIGVKSMDFEALSKVCRMTEGVPLSVELIAPHFRFLDEAQVGERFATLLEHENPAMESKHRSLATAIRSSLDLLNSREREVLAALGTFAGGFTLEAAEAIIANERIDRNEILPALVLLADSSLIQREPDQDLRFKLLESVRHSVQSELSPEQRAAVASRHAEWFANFASENVKELSGDRATAASSALIAEDGNLGKALDYLLEEPVSPLAGALAADLAIWWYRTNWTVGRLRLRQALDRADRFESKIVQSLHNRYGAICESLNSLDEALASYHSAADIARSRGDELGVHAVETNIGLVYKRQHEFEKALALIAKAKEYFELVGQQAYAAKAATNMAACLAGLHRFDEAEALSRQSLAVAESLHLRDSVAMKKSMLAQLALVKVPRDIVAAKALLLEILKDGLILDPTNKTLVLRLLGYCLSAEGHHQLGAHLLGGSQSFGVVVDHQETVWDENQFSNTACEVRKAAGEMADTWIAEGERMPLDTLMELALRATSQ